MRHSPAVKAAAGIRKEKETEIAVGGHHSHSIAEITFARYSDDNFFFRKLLRKGSEDSCWWLPTTLILWER